MEVLVEPGWTAAQWPEGTQEVASFRGRGSSWKDAVSLKIPKKKPEHQGQPSQGSGL